MYRTWVGFNTLELSHDNWLRGNFEGSFDRVLRDLWESESILPRIVKFKIYKEMFTNEDPYYVEYHAKFENGVWWFTPLKNE